MEEREDYIRGLHKIWDGLIKDIGTIIPVSFYLILWYTTTAVTVNTSIGKHLYYDTLKITTSSHTKQTISFIFGVH